MKKLLKAFFLLPPGDFFFLVKAFTLTCILRICLKLFGFNNTLKFLSRFNAPEGRKSAGQDITLYKKLINWTYYFSPLLNCLAICTSFWWLMKLRGLNTDMKFGMAKNGDKLLAHCWLEYEGKLVSYEPDPMRKYIAFNESILK